jgi:hypothetical protein
MQSDTLLPLQLVDLLLHYETAHSAVRAVSS